MSLNTYTYSRSTTQQDNRSYTRFIDLPILTDCGKELPPGFNSEPCGWNGQLCGSDNYYAQPVLKSDGIYLQFKFLNSALWPWRDASNPDDWIIAVEILTEQGDLITDVIEDFSDNYMTGKDGNGVDFQNIIINVLGIPISAGAFIVKVIYKDGDEEVPYYSEPFRLIDCEGTLLLEGTYTTRDFKNNIYSLADGSNWTGTSNFAYRAIHRFLGSYERDEIKITKTLNDSGFVTKIETDDMYNYSLAQIPPYEVEVLSTICGGIEFYVDGVLHEDVSGFKKNNEINRMWRPKFTSTKKPDDPNNNPASGCV